MNSNAKKYFYPNIFISLIWIFIAYPWLGQGQEEYDMPTSTEMETTTVELRCHIALGQWIPKLMEEANMCISDNPTSYDRMKLRNSSIPLPPINVRTETLPPFQCIMRCTGMRLGIFHPDGTVDEQEVVSFIEENVIPQYKDLAYDVLAGCAGFAGALNGTMTDPNCLAHGAIFKCFANQAPKVVKQCAIRVGIHKDSQPQPVDQP